MMQVPQRKPTLRQYITELTKFCHKLNILRFCNIQIYFTNLIFCKAALQRLYREKRDTNNIELKNTFHQPLAVKRERPGFCWVLTPSASVR